MNIESLQRMQNLNQVLEAARRRNGFGAPTQSAIIAKTEAPARNQNVQNFSRFAYKAAATVMREMPVAPEPGRPAKTLGRHIDVMA